MIAASSAHLGSLAARLSARAERLARAHAEMRLRRRKGDPSRWRKPGLLWPLFTKD
ncbi:hypothetical protein [Alteraurantiacibacter aquimixticola]|uniref:hypothetical protein n=1 Tax=Alteraurantiacibacter aquimixticola TaxID=2489173 RepID=UPI00145B8A12|nr:hypothetical protein [Alteraurantiacibacter aquimixticola]